MTTRAAIALSSCFFFSWSLSEAQVPAVEPGDLFFANVTSISRLAASDPGAGARIYISRTDVSRIFAVAVDKNRVVYYAYRAAFTDASSTAARTMLIGRVKSDGASEIVARLPLANASQSLTDMTISATGNIYVGFRNLSENTIVVVRPNTSVVGFESGTALGSFVTGGSVSGIYSVDLAVNSQDQLVVFFSSASAPQTSAVYTGKLGSRLRNAGTLANLIQIAFTRDDVLWGSIRVDTQRSRLVKITPTPSPTKSDTGSDRNVDLPSQGLGEKQHLGGCDRGRRGDAFHLAGSGRRRRAPDAGAFR